PSEFTNPQKTALKFHHFTQKKALSRKKKGTFSARCTVYVRYLYSICTLSKRTNTVHILYIYRTTGIAGAVNEAFRRAASRAVSGGGTGTFCQREKPPSYRTNNQKFEKKFVKNFDNSE
ncbi:MAG: hypothetical protein IJK99_03170, partial [Bacteroidales bacterium]|nr:hypothetical protein [Bacteroidales bacterium]